MFRDGPITSKNQQAGSSNRNIALLGNIYLVLVLNLYL